MYKFIVILGVISLFVACSGAEDLMVKTSDNEASSTNAVSSQSVSSTNAVSSSSKSSSKSSSSSVAVSSSSVASSSSMASSSSVISSSSAASSSVSSSVSVSSSSSVVSSSSSSVMSSSSSSTVSSSSSSSSTGPIMATGYTLEFGGITAISHLQSSYYAWLGYWLSYSQSSWTMTVKLIPANAVNSVSVTSPDPTTMTATKVSGVNQWVLRSYKLIPLPRGFYLKVNIAGLTTAYPDFLVTAEKPL